MKKIKRWAVLLLCFTVIFADTVFGSQAPAETSAAEPKDDIDIQLLDTGIITAEYGTRVGLDLIVVNYGSTTAKDVVVTPVVSADVGSFPFEIESSNYAISVGELKGAGTEALRPDSGVAVGNENAVGIHYDFAVRNDVLTGYSPVSFDIKYKDSSDQWQSTSVTIYIKTIGKPEEKEEPSTTPESQAVSVPRVIVSGYVTEPSEVKAGENFKLTLSIQNTSGKSAVQNLKIVLSAGEEGAFLPVSGSSTVFLNSIKAGKTAEVSVDMTAKADLEQKPYQIGVAIDYEDTKANQYQTSESVSIPVKQEARCEISNIEIMPSSIMVGEEANIMFNIYNKGKAKLYNVTVKFEGNEAITSEEYFAGTIEPGATAAVDEMLVGVAPSDGEMMKAVVTFEDEAGVQTVVEKEFELMVNEMIYDDTMTDDMNMDDMMMEEEKKGPNILLIVGIAAVVIVAAAAAAFILIRRKKKKEGIEEDEIS